MRERCQTFILRPEFRTLRQTRCSQQVGVNVADDLAYQFVFFDVEHHFVVSRYSNSIPLCRLSLVGSPRTYGCIKTRCVNSSPDSTGDVLRKWSPCLVEQLIVDIERCAHGPSLDEVR